MSPSSYYQYVSEPDAYNTDEQQDSRHLPAEARTKTTYHQNQSPQRYKSIEQPTNQEPQQQQSQAQVISEDEYLELIRNTELARGPQAVGVKQIYTQSATQSPVSPVTLSAIAYVTPSKSTFNIGDYKKFSSARPQAPSVQSPQYTRQLVPTQAGYPADYSHVEYTPAEKEVVTRINGNKKYADSNSKVKYDQTHGQYHQEVKSKKYITFKPQQYQSLAQSPLTQQYAPQHIQNQHLMVQQQSVQQGQPKIIYQPQSLRNYQTIVPQAHIQQQQQQPQHHHQQQQQPHQSSFYDSNIAYNQYLPQTERFVASPYNPIGSDDVIRHTQNNLNSQFLDEQNGGGHKQILHQQQQQQQPQQHPEYRIQYVNAPQRTKAVNNKYTSDSIDSVSQHVESQSPRFEYFESSSDESPKTKANTVKIVQPPQLQYERPQLITVEPQQSYYQKKVKYQPGVPAQLQQQHQRQQTHHHHQVPPSSHAESLSPSQPSRSSIFVAQTLGVHGGGNEQTDSGNQNQSPIPIGHQTHSDARQKPLPPLPITNPKKPITQAEFQALVDAGYKVQAIPVPVPVAVSPEKFKLLQQQQQQRTQYLLQNPSYRQQQTSNQAPIRYVRQQQTSPQRHIQAASSEESLLATYLRPLIDYIGGPTKPNA